MVLDGFLDLRRYRREISLQRRARIEIKNRPQNLLELRQTHLRNVVIKNYIDERTSRIGLRVAGSNRSGARPGPNLDALIPFRFFDRAAIYLEANVIAPDVEGTNAGLVAWLHGRTVHTHEHFQFPAIGRDNTILQGKALFAHGKWGANVDQFRLQGTKHFHPRFLAEVRRRSAWLLALAKRGTS